MFPRTATRSEGATMKKSEIAVGLFREGYNCAESVALAFAEETGIPRETLRRVALPLGAGVGRLRQICGAVSGAAVCLGLIFPERSKSEIYALVQKFACEFRKRRGSLVCRELLQNAGCEPDDSPLPEARTERFYETRPCAALVGEAAGLLEAILTGSEEPSDV